MGLMVGWALSALIGWWVGSFLGRTKKIGRQGGGIIGLFFGPIGWFFIWLLPDFSKRFCPFCKSVLNEGAKICHKCNREVAPALFKKQSAQHNPRSHFPHADPNSTNCPYCEKPILNHNLVVGVNACPYCGGEFDVE